MEEFSLSCRFPHPRRLLFLSQIIKLIFVWHQICLCFSPRLILPPLCFIITSSPRYSSPSHLKCSSLFFFLLSSPSALVFGFLTHFLSHFSPLHLPLHAFNFISSSLSMSQSENRAPDHWVNLRHYFSHVSGFLEIPTNTAINLYQCSDSLSFNLAYLYNCSKRLCTSIGSESASKDFILIPNDSQGAVASPAEVYVSLHG